MKAEMSVRGCAILRHVPRCGTEVLKGRIESGEESAVAAPAIVLVALGDEDPSVGRALNSIVTKLRGLRPDLDVSLGLLGPAVSGGAGVIEVVEKLAGNGTTEIALVPLDLVSAADHSPVVSQARDAVERINQNVHVVISRPIGPATELLNVLDDKVREALHRVNAVEIDALVLTAPEGGDVRGTSLLARRARQWSTHHKLPVQLAVGDESGRASGTAVSALRGQGRRHIAVGSLFLSSGPLYRAHKDAALRAGAIAVGDPVSDDPRLVELVLARYAFAAMDLLDAEPFGDADED